MFPHRSVTDESVGKCVRLFLSFFLRPPLVFMTPCRRQTIIQSPLLPPWAPPPDLAAWGGGEKQDHVSEKHICVFSPKRYRRGFGADANGGELTTGARLYEALRSGGNRDARSRLCRAAAGGLCYALSGAARRSALLRYRCVRSLPTHITHTNTHAGSSADSAGPSYFHKLGPRPRSSPRYSSDVSGL